ncbi:hypothetical protein H9X84_05370 [Anaerotignum lactatifermentans]|uniref:Uncharacterized protein n=1 Tax=Anaerotignum lactatifermentans TaxID=160404 RepID=A0ABS2G783_9FIRM|nr:hypothetical protein [Anaerotignum lactatifermentans]MBM6877334.1 hypothetical protein [Anaerotignum lactatifermentans]
MLSCFLLAADQMAEAEKETEMVFWNGWRSWKGLGRRKSGDTKREKQKA